MVDDYVDSNLIVIPLIRVRGLRSEFDCTYPMDLDGIITRSEFQQSLYNINRTLLLRRAFGFFAVLLIFFVIVGIVLAVVEGTSAKSQSDGIFFLVYIGIGIFAFGILVSFSGFCFVKLRYTSQMKEAIGQESIKYSTRSPNPCTWRLEGYTAPYTLCDCRCILPVYQLIIQIGNGVISGYSNKSYHSNRVAPQQRSLFMQKREIPPSQSYSTGSTPKFCSQCGALKQDSRAKFCSACGQPFHL